MADDCEAVADLLDAAAEGALPPAAMAVVGAHVAGCAACRDAMAATALLLCATSAQAQAQAQAPTGAAERQLAQDRVAIIAPFPPGGPADTLA